MLREEMTEDTELFCKNYYTHLFNLSQSLYYSTCVLTVIHNKKCSIVFQFKFVNSFLHHKNLQ